MSACERCQSRCVLQGQCIACGHVQGFRPRPAPLFVDGRCRPDGIVEFDGVPEPPRRWPNDATVARAADRWLREHGG